MPEQQQEGPTPEPWSVYVFGENREHINVIRGTVEGHEFEQVIASLPTRGNEGSYEESLANADLIAAVHPLLAAAQAVVTWLAPRMGCSLCGASLEPTYPHAVRCPMPALTAAISSALEEAP